MATRIIPGQRRWGLTRDEGGHRTYSITHLVDAGVRDGPANVIQTPGLPVPGNWWIVDDDVDVWAWCRPDATVEIHQEREGDKSRIWAVTQKFSTKPPQGDEKKYTPGIGGGGSYCYDKRVEDPLLEPQKVSGGFSRYTKEAVYDRFGVRIDNSAHEQMRGPQVEFDDDRDKIRIEQNVAVLNLALCSSMKNTVNSAALWGLAKRCIKLASFTWERKIYGLCYVYYTRIFDFETNSKTFDRDLLDEGTKAIRGHWDTDPTSSTYKHYIVDGQASSSNPADFIRFKDFNGENARVLLDGSGFPVGGSSGTSPGDAGKIHVEYYGESDFLQLGIPTSF